MCFLGHCIHPESISMSYHQGCDRIKVEYLLFHRGKNQAQKIQMVVLYAQG